MFGRSGRVRWLIALAAIQTACSGHVVQSIKQPPSAVAAKPTSWERLIDTDVAAVTHVLPTRDGGVVVVIVSPPESVALDVPIRCGDNDSSQSIVVAFDSAGNTLFADCAAEPYAEVTAACIDPQDRLYLAGMRWTRSPVISHSVWVSTRSLSAPGYFREFPTESSWPYAMAVTNSGAVHILVSISGDLFVDQQRFADPAAPGYVSAHGPSVLIGLSPTLQTMYAREVGVLNEGKLIGDELQKLTTLQSAAICSFYPDNRVVPSGVTVPSTCVTEPLYVLTRDDQVAMAGECYDPKLRPDDRRIAIRRYPKTFRNSVTTQQPDPG
jgi:hypothetical protein